MVKKKPKKSRVQGIFLKKTQKKGDVWHITLDFLENYQTMRSFLQDPVGSLLPILSSLNPPQ
jgi:hypothetical protein